MPLYLDLDVFHMRDHENRGGPEAGNLQQQFKNSEKFAFIFQKRKQQETMQHEALKRCFPRTVLGVFFQKIQKKSKKYLKKFNF